MVILIEVLRWARANGYPWDEGIFTIAADNDHLEMLKWERARRVGKYESVFKRKNARG